MTMGSVDLADQLRETYRVDNGVRNRKWWWSILFWAIGVMLTNAYIIYITINLKKGKNKKDLFSHHDFRKEIALAWINPNERKNAIQKPADSIITRRKRFSSEISTPSTITEESLTLRNKKATRMTDEALKPNGSLSCRLQAAYDHLPERPHTNKARCALHRWAGVEYRASMLYCLTCNVNLCLNCYKNFHQNVNILQTKKSLGN